MPEPTLSMTADDDLPRTIRREREARERDAREREARERSGAVSVPGSVMAMHTADQDARYATAAPAVVTGLEVPFFKLMTFFIKAVFAAIPALIVLTVLLWLFGQGLQSYFPQLLKLKILIYMPQ